VNGQGLRVRGIRLSVLSSEFRVKCSQLGSKDFGQKFRVFGSGCRSERSGLLVDSLLGGVCHCRLHCRLAKFYGLLYREKTSL